MEHIRIAAEAEQRSDSALPSHPGIAGIVSTGATFPDIRDC
jgi:hypothetical protein